MKTLGNVVIIGDSYSTYTGYIPAGYGSYYSDEGSERTDVNKVEQTWWHSLITETGSRLILNSSWSGATICNTGYEGKDFSHCSFVSRIDKLADEDFFKKNGVNTVIVLGGTNDSWSGAPLGEAKLSEWTKEDLYEVLPAMAYMFERLKSNTSEGTEIYYVLNSECLKAPITELFHTLCQKHGDHCIPVPHLDRRCSHPTIQGMQDIKNEIIKYLAEHK